MFERLAAALLAILIVPGLSVAAGAAAPEAPGDFRLFDGFAYSDAKARKLWQPMAGSPPVSVAERDGRRVLKLACPFAGSKIERASWDREVALDMTACKGVQFLFRGGDLSPISSFTMYLHSKDGWYRGHFYPTAARGWGRVRIFKSKMGVEDSPAGWGRIDRIRLSAWRGRNAETSFEIAELGLFGTGGKVAVIRADSAAGRSSGEARAVQQYADVIVEFLDRAGIGNVVLSDRDVTAARLKGMKVVVLPYSPSMPERVIDELARFIESGGKLVANYILPGRLQKLVGIKSGGHVSQEYRGYFASIRASDAPLAGAPAAVGQASWNVHRAEAVAGKSRVAAWWHTDKGVSTSLPAVVVSDNAVHLTHVLIADDRQAKQQLLLAMIGHLMPEAWSAAAEGRFARIGRFGPYADYAAAAAGIGRQAGGNRAAAASLERAGKLQAKAAALLKAGKHVEAIAASGEAGTAMLEAHCLAQKPLAGEHRGIWCHSALGVAGMTWDEAVKVLADNGMTAVLPNMLWGGVAFYKSDVLPVAKEVAEQGDQIALCLAACKKHGVACHVWKVNYNMGWRTPASFAKQMLAAGRTQVGPDGSPNARWLCPSHPANQKLEIDAMVEVARKYDVDGVHFDYIRYPGRQGCFCAGCRERFEKAVGRKVARWPADVRLRGPLHEQWMAFRREQITAVVAAVAERARKARPGVKISAAVFRNWPSDRDAVGQDWKVWCDRGYVDFVCPMDYTPRSEHFRAMVTSQRPWAGKVGCYPGIGVSVWPNPTDVAKLIEQVRIARELGTKGFTIFNYDPPVAREVLPMLGKGMTRRR